MTPEALISFASLAALFILCAAFLLTVYRVVIGPTLPDRVVALDMLVGIAIGFIAVIAVRTGFTLYIDIAIALCLVGFLATVAFSRFILSRQPVEGQRRTDVLDGTDVVPRKRPSEKGDKRLKKGKRNEKQMKGKKK